MDHNQGVEIYSPGYFHNHGGAKSENDFLKAAPGLCIDYYKYRLLSIRNGLMKVGFWQYQIDTVRPWLTLKFDWSL